MLWPLLLLAVWPWYGARGECGPSPPPSDLGSRSKSLACGRRDGQSGGLDGTFLTWFKINPQLPLSPYTRKSFIFGKSRW